VASLLGAWTLGLIMALLALGIFLSFRIFSFADITTDGSFAFGAAITAVCLVRGWGPLPATAAGFCAGMLAGAATGILHTKFGINGLLAGILVMTSLYSVNLGVMGKSNIPLTQSVTLVTYADRLSAYVLGETGAVRIGIWSVGGRELFLLLFTLVIAVVVGVLMYFFFRTNLGTAMRASGDNPQMIRALGVDVGNMMIAGLALANGLTALAGALLAQYNQVADLQMGIGMVVWGLASVIIGEALVGSTSIGLTVAGTIIGSVLFRLIVAGALRMGLPNTYLKLATAVFVFVALVLPGQLKRLRKQR
jgi:putative tryptophan/tyrosine transport system permease protein